MITNKAITLSRNQEFLEDCLNVITFKFSSKWLDGFLINYNLCNCYKIIVS